MYYSTPTSVLPFNSDTKHPDLDQMPQVKGSVLNKTVATSGGVTNGVLPGNLHCRPTGYIFERFHNPQ